MKDMNPYLIFNGNCNEAMKFYEKSLNAELTMMPFSEGPDCPPGSENRIMHARLSKGSVVLMASDTMPGMPFSAGNNFSISINCESTDEVKNFFTNLSEKGKVTMPLQDTFWGAYFGMLTDQFGINWMFNFDKNQK